MQWYHGLPVFTFFSCTGGSFFCFEKVHWSNCLWLQDIYSPYRFFFQDTTLLSILWFMSHFFWDVWLKFSCPKPVQVNNLNLFPFFLGFLQHQGIEVCAYDFICIFHSDLEFKISFLPIVYFSGHMLHRNMEIVDYLKCCLMDWCNEEFTIISLFLRIPICAAYCWTTSGHRALEAVLNVMIS